MPFKKSVKSSNAENRDKENAYTNKGANLFEDKVVGLEFKPGYTEKKKKNGIRGNATYNGFSIFTPDPKGSFHVINENSRSIIETYESRMKHVNPYGDWGVGAGDLYVIQVLKNTKGGNDYVELLKKHWNYGKGEFEGGDKGKNARDVMAKSIKWYFGLTDENSAMAYTEELDKYSAYPSILSSLPKNSVELTMGKKKLGILLVTSGVVIPVSDDQTKGIEETNPDEVQKKAREGLGL